MLIFQGVITWNLNVSSSLGLFHPPKEGPSTPFKTKVIWEVSNPTSNALEALDALDIFRDGSAGVSSAVDAAAATGATGAGERERLLQGWIDSGNTVVKVDG